MANTAESSEIKPPKHQKLSDDTTDRISKLPESLLLHILSLLTTKEAARTSVLSKQWRFLWSWVPAVHIDKSCFPKTGMTSEQFLLKIMLSRREWSIRKFKLASYYSSKFANLGLIVSAVMERNLRELTLKIKVHRTLFKLPDSFFSCKTIVVLKLEGHISLQFDSAVHFPSLTDLVMRRVTLDDEDSFRSLFDGCPLLEDVFMDDCIVGAALRYQISSITIRRLSFRTYPHCYNYDYDSLSGSDFAPPTITINAPALKHLSIEYGGAPSVLVLQNMHNLVEAKLRVEYMRFDSTTPGLDLTTMKNIFHSVANVRCLEMQFDFDLSQDIEYPVSQPHIFPRFDNLVQLVMNAHFYLWPSVFKLLHCCPRLQHFTLHQFSTESEEPQCWLPPEVVPNCLSSHLTTCKIYNFKCTKAEMEIIGYLLKNSNVLRIMTIAYSWAALERLQMLLIKKAFFKLEKSSERCELIFEAGWGDF